jgi:hypothetical protein
MTSFALTDVAAGDVRRRLRELAALIAWSGATLVALSGMVLTVHDVEPDPAIQAFAAYAVLTGIGSIGLAYSNRRPTLLGSWAWLALLAWGAHLWAVVWLINIDALDLHELITAQPPVPPVWPAVVILLGVIFLVIEGFVIRLVRAQRERALEISSPRTATFDSAAGD